MPLVAHAAGIEAKWEFLVGRRPGRGRFERNEAPLPIRGIEAALHEEPPVLSLRRFAGTQRPLHGIERVECCVADCCKSADVEIAPAAILEGGQRGVLAK